MTLIEQIRALGLGDKHFAGEYTIEPFVGGWHLQQDPAEFAELIEALAGRPIHSYLQIGSAAGGAERFICERNGIKSLYIIDEGTHPQFPVWENLNKPALQNMGVRVTEHLGDSHDEAAEVFLKGLAPIKFDLVGIDGDHTPAGVRMDWELVAPHVKPGSLVWFHDTNPERMRPQDNGPWEVWCKLKERHKVILETFRNFGIGLLEVV